WINEMYIDADYRSRGFGGRALELVTAWAAAQGCRRAVAWTGRSNTLSQRLFGSAGFVMHEVVALDKRLD
ncbi:MAG TPA: GNAT family N-acetyltransferase, partial [candidate division Zixibacteria bacterium]|nr:GNAT family N-acetyltransferase [candidate division Zixibacteria bacterium]